MPNFNLEFKITYEELAPSLQDMFRSLQVQINDALGAGGLKDVIEEGEEGQVLKIDKENEEVFADDNFRDLMIITDDAQIAAIKEKYNPSVYLRNVFNEWNRFIHYDNDSAIYMDNTNALYQEGGVEYHGQNYELSDQPTWTKVLDKNVTTNGGWSYNSQENRIYCNFDLGMFAGFISPTPVSNNYYIHFWVDSFQDDDHFCIILGYMKGDDGVEHTLTYIRAEGQHYNIHKPDTYYNTGLQYIDTRVWSAVVYDFMNPTQKILADNSALVGVAPYMEPVLFRAHVAVRRQGKNFTFYTSQWSQEKTPEPEFVDAWTLTFNIPDEKPADWDQTMWENINTMMQLNYFGVGSRSNPSAFSIEYQTGIFPNTETIYNINNDTKWVWNFQTEEYEDAGHITKEDIPYRSLLYCSYYQTFYYYWFPGSYQEIVNKAAEGGGGGASDEDITNIQNQITNILADISDLEEQIAQINANIANMLLDITDLENRVSILENKDYETSSFLNMAPHIGYYQEDQLGIISKYNMNNQLYGVIIYPSNRGQMAYCLANTGAYNDSTDLKVYRGERSSNNQRFQWDNEPREIGFFKDRDDLALRSLIWCDNYHMIVLTRPAGSDIAYFSNANKTDVKLWWIDTNNSADESTWTTGIEITNIIIDAYKNGLNLDLTTRNNDAALHRGTPYRNVGASGWYYDEEYDTFTFFIYPLNEYTTGRDGKNIKCCVYKRNGTRIGIYDMGNYLSAFRFTQEWLDKGYSFNRDSKVADADSENSTKTQQYGSGWTTWSFLYYPEKELCLLMVNDATLEFYRDNLDRKDESVDFYIRWRIPHSIHRGQGGTITKIQGDHDNIPLGTDNLCRDNHKWVNNSIIGKNDAWVVNTKSFMMQSRDLFNNIIYCGTFFVVEYYKDEYSRRLGFIFYGGNRIDEVTDPKYQGSISEPLNINYLLCPDASLWGKSHKSTSAFYDDLFFMTENMKTDMVYNPNTTDPSQYPIVNFNGFRCKDFSFYGEDSSGCKIILPKHNMYEYIGDCDRTLLYTYPPEEAGQVERYRYSPYGYPGNEFLRYLPEPLLDEFDRDPYYYSKAKTVGVKEGEPYYIICKPFDTTYQGTTSNIHVEAINTTWNEDSKTFESSVIKSLDFGVADNDRFANIVNRDLHRAMDYRCPMYNPYGDYFFLSLTDANDNEYNDQVSGKTYFVLIMNDGTIKPFGKDFESKWCSDYVLMMNQCHQQAQNGEYYKQQFCFMVALSDKKIYVSFFRYSLFSMDFYNCLQLCIEFNNDYSDFTMTNCEFNKTSGIRDNLGTYNSTGWTETDIGFTYSTVTGVMINRTSWKVAPTILYTQKPLPGDTSGTTYTADQILNDFLTNSNKYAMYLESNTFPVGYIPAIPIFLGGYFSIIEEPIAIEFTPSQHNYIYLQRDPNDKTNIICEISDKLTIQEGEKMFSRICVADINCDASQITDVTYYHINIGYNDYKWETGIY